MNLFLPDGAKPSIREKADAPLVGAGQPMMQYHQPGRGPATERTDMEWKEANRLRRAAEAAPLNSNVMSIFPRNQLLIYFQLNKPFIQNVRGQIKRHREIFAKISSAAVDVRT